MFDFLKRDLAESKRFVKFKLSSDFLSKYFTKEVNWGPLGEITYIRTYSRWIEDSVGERYKESWWQTVCRVVEGVFTIQKLHCFNNRIPWNNAKAQTSAKKMYELMFTFKFLPPGRGLWAMGSDYVYKRGGSCLNNCGFSTTKHFDIDPITPFLFLMDMSMLGVGVGFDTLGAKLDVKVYNPSESEEVFVVPDSREGWVEVLKITLEAFLFSDRFMPKFDFSKVRPEGTYIKGFGGTASGPQPLIDMIECIKRILSEANAFGFSLNSTIITDIMNLIGKCVVSGNVRRSSEIAIGEIDDSDFMSMKDYKINPFENSKEGWRWASNNSIKGEVGMNYKKIADYNIDGIDTGIIWLDNMRKYGRLVDPPNWVDKAVDGCNPCSEQSLEGAPRLVLPFDPENMYAGGGELCCLVETFPSLHDSYEEYEETIKYAYMYAKTVTLIPTHWEGTNSIMLRNRRIGTSQSGITQAFVKHGRNNMLDWCDKGYKYITHMDDIYSDWLCVPRSIKKTSVKPSGSVSLLPGVSPGIHYDWAEYYIRRIRIGRSDKALINILKAAGHRMDYSEGDRTYAVQFPVKVDNFSQSEGEVSMWQQANNVADYQRYWADNQVSCTIKYHEHEKGELASLFESFERQLKSISVLPYYDPTANNTEQAKEMMRLAPYETIDEECYQEMISELSEPDYSSYIKDSVSEKFCDGESCNI